MSLLAEPVAVVEIGRAEAVDLCVRWEHELGGCDRPFGQDHFALVVDGEPVASWPSGWGPCRAQLLRHAFAAA
jgi:hypothetical protein